MKNLRNVSFRTNLLLAVLVVLICTVGALTSLASAPLTITVTNNSSWEIRHLYLSSASNDNWGPDQLDNSSINPGNSHTLNVSWDQSTVKLIGEDQDGCFVSTTVNASGSASWTIDSNATRHCGGE